MLKPGKCLICETHPGHRVVDTGYNLTAATVFDKLRGRKYICSGCGEKIGKALGMITQVQVNALQVEIKALSERRDELAEQVRITEQLDDLRTFLGGGSVEAPAPVENEGAATTGGD
jgi:hypothetical protein